jgi:hypothetical protein
MRLGWDVEDLFGLHPTAGLNRHDAAALIRMLKGERVVAPTVTEARLSGDPNTTESRRGCKRHTGGGTEPDLARQSWAHAGTDIQGQEFEGFTGLKI